MRAIMILKIDGKDCQIIPNNGHHKVVALTILVNYLGNNLLSEHGLENWKIETGSIESKYLGVCSFKKCTITINKTCLYILDSSALKDVILHEIAHALVGSAHNHDQIWRAKALEIGCDGEIGMEIKELLKVGDDKYKIKLEAKNNL